MSINNISWIWWVIAEVNESKYFGVSIDHQLSCNDHISFVHWKTTHGIGMIMARKTLRSEYLNCLFYSFVYPCTIYCKFGDLRLKQK